MSPTRTQAYGENMPSAASKYNSFRNKENDSKSSKYQDSSSKLSTGLFGSTRKSAKCDNCNEDRGCSKTKQSCDKYDW